MSELVTKTCYYVRHKYFARTFFIRHNQGWKKKSIKRFYYKIW